MAKREIVTYGQSIELDKYQNQTYINNCVHFYRALFRKMGKENRCYIIKIINSMNTGGNKTMKLFTDYYGISLNDEEKPATLSEMAKNGRKVSKDIRNNLDLVQIVLRHHFHALYEDCERRCKFAPKRIVNPKVLSGFNLAISNEPLEEKYEPMKKQKKQKKGTVILGHKQATIYEMLKHEYGIGAIIENANLIKFNGESIGGNYYRTLEQRGCIEIIERVPHKHTTIKVLDLKYKLEKRNRQKSSLKIRSKTTDASESEKTIIATKNNKSNDVILTAIYKKLVKTYGVGGIVKDAVSFEFEGRAIGKKLCIALLLNGYVEITKMDDENITLRVLNKVQNS